MPAMTHANRLACECVRFEGSEKQGYLGDVLERGELPVHGLAEQDVLHHALLRDAELLRLLGNLLLDQRSQNKAWADDVRAHIVVRAFLGHNASKTEKSVLSGNVSGLERGSLMAVHRSHVKQHAAVLL